MAQKNKSFGSRPLRTATSHVLERRTQYKQSLIEEIGMLENRGCADNTLAHMKERVACIEWMESRNDSRALDSTIMAEFRRSMA